MTWVDQLQPASFRNVLFQVDTIDVTAGDNVVLREYPFQDLPTVFRMGEGAEEIKFSAYVIGDDYMDKREALRQVLTGEGELVHPTAGTLRVFVAGKYSIKEAPTAEGGMARFDLTFVRAEPRRYPAGQVCTPDDAIAQADAAEEAAMDDFAASWELDGAAGWTADLALARVQESIAGVWGEVGPVVTGLGVNGVLGAIGGAAGSIGDFTNGIIGNYQALRDGLNTLVRQPRLLANAVRELFRLPSDLANAAARDFVAAFEGLFDIGKKVNKRDFEVRVMPAVGAGLVMYGTGSATALGLNTPARAQLGRLTAASDQLVETLATAAWVRAVARVELAGYDEALALRATLHTQAMRLLVRASSAPASDGLPALAWHDAMLALLTAGLRDVQERSRDMAQLGSYTPEGWTPVWAVSFRLYGTAGYADEIMAMNPHITHPLLVPPGKPLRIVRHD